MFWSAIPLPPGVEAILIQLFAAVGRGIVDIAQRLKSPHLIDARAALRVLRRIEKILRYTYVMAATHMKDVPARVRNPVAAGRASSPARNAEPGLSGHGASAPDWPDPGAFARARFKAFRNGAAAYTLDDPNEANHPQPTHLIGAKANYPRLIARKLAELRDGIDNALRYITHYAQDFAADVLYIAPRPPTTRPPTAEREYWEEFACAAKEARFQFSEYWRRRREDTS
jgi:hypothetical protein